MLAAILVCAYGTLLYGGRRVVTQLVHDLPKADRVWIEGSFIDYTTRKPSQVSIELTEPAEIQQLATLFKDAEVELLLGKSLTAALPCLCAVRGEIEWQVHGKRRRVRFDGNSLKGNAYAVCSLKNFSSNSIYDMLKDMNKLEQSEERQASGSQSERP